VHGTASPLGNRFLSVIGSRTLHVGFGRRRYGRHFLATAKLFVIWWRSSSAYVNKLCFYASKYCIFVTTVRLAKDERCLIHNLHVDKHGGFESIKNIVKMFPNKWAHSCRLRIVNNKYSRRLGHLMRVLPSAVNVLWRILRRSNLWAKINIFSTRNPSSEIYSRFFFGKLPLPAPASPNFFLPKTPPVRPGCYLLESYKSICMARRLAANSIRFRRAIDAIDSVCREGVEEHSNKRRSLTAWKSMQSGPRLALQSVQLRSIDHTNTVLIHLVHLPNWLSFCDQPASQFRSFLSLCSSAFFSFWLILFLGFC